MVYKYFQLFVYGVITPSICCFTLYHIINCSLTDIFKNAIKEAIKEIFHEIKK
jgi:hypothetical protein